VVALESTVIAHGLPYPTNLETARRMEDMIRQRGAAPATIAVIDGQLRAGVTDAELEHLATGKGISKVSRRDLPVVVAQGGDGATTVASTATIAAWAGIEIFATGGIGGVHRGASASFDVSTDLEELGRTPVAVVCSGAKAILDLPATHEVLETQGIPIIGFQTDEFPAFYSSSSGLPVDQRVETPDEAARIAMNAWEAGLKSAVLLVVPPPAESAMPTDQMEVAIQSALEEASQQGIHGAATTPFLLSRVSELTGGHSLQANLELLKNNARVAAQVAVAMKTPNTPGIF